MRGCILIHDFLGRQHLRVSQLLCQACFRLLPLLSLADRMARLALQSNLVQRLRGEAIAVRLAWVLLDVHRRRLAIGQE